MPIYLILVRSSRCILNFCERKGACWVPRFLWVKWQNGSAYWHEIPSLLFYCCIKKWTGCRRALRLASSQLKVEEKENLLLFIRLNESLFIIKFVGLNISGMHWRKWGLINFNKINLDLLTFLFKTLFVKRLLVV